MLLTPKALVVISLHFEQLLEVDLAVDVTREGCIGASAERRREGGREGGPGAGGGGGGERVSWVKDVRTCSRAGTYALTVSV